MKTAPVSELKARLSEYLNQVKAGMEVLITDHCLLVHLPSTLNPRHRLFSLVPRPLPPVTRIRPNSKLQTI